MKSILFLTLSTLAFHSYAQNQYVCTRGGSERIIEVVYHQPDSKVPCDVKYTKSEGTEILWSANNEVGYCENKATEFTIQSASRGWSCSGSNNGT
jgi:hypothetical protein